MSRIAKRITVIGMAGLLGLLGLFCWRAGGLPGGIPGIPTVPRAFSEPPTTVGDGIRGILRTPTFLGTSTSPEDGSADLAEFAEFSTAEYPEIATVRLIQVSLGLLAKNGADLHKPMPVRHRVLAAGPGVAARVVAWARTSGYDSSAPAVFHEHGGVERFEIELVRVVVPDPLAIELQGREVFAAVGSIPGAMYQSWMGDIVR